MTYPTERQSGKDGGGHIANPSEREIERGVRGT